MSCRDTTPRIRENQPSVTSILRDESTGKSCCRYPSTGRQVNRFAGSQVHRFAGSRVRGVFRSQIAACGAAEPGEHKARSCEQDEAFVDDRKYEGPAVGLTEPRLCDPSDQPPTQAAPGTSRSGLQTTRSSVSTPILRSRCPMPHADVRAVEERTEASPPVRPIPRADVPRPCHSITSICAQ
jgi:hypothetical protein